MNGEILPKFKIPLSLQEKILIASTVLVNIFTWVYLLIQWSEIPSKIPSHFDLLGNPDAWSGKNSILISPIMFTLITIVIILLSRIPQHFNYVVTITKENAERQYKNAREMILWLSFYISILGFYMPWSTIQVGNGNSNGLNAWVMILIMVAIFGTLGQSIYKMNKLK